MNVYYLVGLDGKEEYKRNAKTKKEFIKSLIDEGIKDFRNYSFERFDFSGLDLSDCDFSGSQFSNCKFVATELTGAKFNEVFIEETDFSNSYTYRKLQINGSTLVDNDMYKVKWMNSDIINTEVMRNNFEKSSLTGSNVEESTWNKNDFTDAKLGRVLKDYSKWIKNDFNGTDFSSNTNEKTNLRAHGDKYSVHAGNTVSKTTIYDNDNNDVLKSDIRFNKVFDLMSSTAIAASLGIAAYYLGGTEIGAHLMTFLNEQVNSFIGDIGTFAGGGAAAIFTFSAANFIRGKVTEYIESKFSDPLKDKITEMSINIRGVINTLPKKFNDYRNLIVAVGEHKTLAPLIKAMESRELKEKRNNANLVAKYVLRPKEESFIICDKKHLAEALSYMSKNRDKGYSVQKDIIILKGDSDKSNVPSSIRFHKNGKTTILWDDNEGQTKYGILYDKCGNPENVFDYQLGIHNVDIKDVPNSETMIMALNTLERYVLNKNGLTDFSYNTDNNIIRSGNNGEIIVERKSTGKVDNNYDGQLAPAILKPVENSEKEWEREYFIDGREIIDPFRDTDELDDFYNAQETINEVEEIIKNSKNSYEKEEEFSLKI